MFEGLLRSNKNIGYSDEDTAQFSNYESDSGSNFLTAGSWHCYHKYSGIVPIFFYVDFKFSKIIAVKFAN